MGGRRLEPRRRSGGAVASGLGASAGHPRTQYLPRAAPQSLAVESRRKDAEGR